MVNKYKSQFGFKALVSKQNFHSFTLLEEDLAIVHMKKTCVEVDRPMYTGVAVLDLSEKLIYHFYYGLKKKQMQQRNLKLLQYPSI